MEQPVLTAFTTTRLPTAQAPAMARPGEANLRYSFTIKRMGVPAATPMDAILSRALSTSHGGCFISTAGWWLRACRCLACYSADVARLRESRPARDQPLHRAPLGPGRFNEPHLSASANPHLSLSRMQILDEHRKPCRESNPQSIVKRIFRCLTQSYRCICGRRGRPARCRHHAFHDDGSPAWPAGRVQRRRVRDGQRISAAQSSGDHHLLREQTPKTRPRGASLLCCGGAHVLEADMFD
jgi:hypothetical protein